jgi:molybdopterin-guanine dinucleotide biosynthesis protein A
MGEQIPHVRDRIAGYILAGGMSSRLGRDKALVELAGRPLLLHMQVLLSTVVSRVTVVAPLRYSALGVNMIPDEWPGYGPLGGIATALRHTGLELPECDWNLILGCDMPFLSKDWLEYLANRTRNTTADVVVPQTSRGLEPLCAAYHTRCAAALAVALDRGVRKITDGLKGLAVEYVGEPAWKQFDSRGTLFKNINTPEDYREVLAAWEAQKR